MLFTKEMDLQVHDHFLERRSRLKSCMSHAGMHAGGQADSYTAGEGEKPERVPGGIRLAEAGDEAEGALTGFPSDRYLESLGADVRTALEFLYAWMPVSDVMMYPAETYLDFARRGVWLRKNRSQVTALPADFFGEYVLFHRVNNEEIRPCRELFGEQLDRRLYEEHGERKKPQTEEERALEINRWAAENGTYHSDDIRTISAEAFYRRGYGRCGEESVFVVNAMRAAGVPARQVYAPWWAHTDDNHAWVEVWAAGRWQFLGACEPQSVLNQGWFNRASSRTMLIRSRAYTKGAFLADEDIIGTDGCVTECNQTARYREVRKIQVQVPRRFAAPGQAGRRPDAPEQPVSAQSLMEKRNGQTEKAVVVELQVYNEGSWKTLAREKTDEEGQLSFSTGDGMLRIHPLSSALQDASLQAGSGDAEVMLTAAGDEDDTEPGESGQNLREPDGGWQQIEYAAPSEKPVLYPQADAGQRKADSAFLERAAEIRNERTKDWEAEGTAFLRNASGSPEQALVKKTVLSSLSEKDLTDCREEIVRHHLTAVLKSGSRERLSDPEVVGLRIGNEVLSSWFEEVSAYLGEERIAYFAAHPEEIWTFVNDHVHELPQEDFGELIMTPGAALRSGVCNQNAREVLAAAVARVCGIPARIREDDGTAEYRVSNSRSEKGASSVQAEYLPFDSSRRETSCLTLHTDDEADVKYETTWGLTRLSDEGQPDQFLALKDNWNKGHMDIPLVPGRYCLVTAQRLPNGNAHVLEYHIRAEADKKADIRLKMQQIRPEEMFVSVDMPPLHLRADNGEAVRKQNGQKRLYIWLAPGQEPTEHILNEMLDNAESYERIAPAVSLITDTPAQKEQRLVRKVTGRFPSIQCCYAEDPSEREMLMRSFYLDPGQLPFIFVTDRSGHGIFSAGGYQVGTGRLLIRIMNL